MERDSKAPRHPIRVVARRTGLTPAALRAWERRYGVVEPTRSDGGQRLYSDEDVARLSLLHRATQAGRSIGQIAGLPVAELEALVRDDETSVRTRPRGARGAADAALDDALVDAALDAVRALDAEALEHMLRTQAVALGVARFTEELLAPLLHRVGDGWQAGTLRPAHEHLATAVLRRVIDWLARAAAPADASACVVIGTPSGERHELGAMLAAATAAAEGWRVLYVGPDLPAGDFVTTAQAVGAVAVGLSLVNPQDMTRYRREIADIRERLPSGVVLVVGGAAAPLLGAALDRDGIERVTDLATFRALLRAAVPPRAVA